MIAILISLAMIGQADVETMKFGLGPEFRGIPAGLDLSEKEAAKYHESYHMTGMKLRGDVYKRVVSGSLAVDPVNVSFMRDFARRDMHVMGDLAQNKKLNRNFRRLADQHFKLALAVLDKLKDK